MDIVEDSLPVSLDTFLDRRLFCFLTSGTEAGPRVSPLWFLWEDGILWTIADTEGKSYPQRVADNPETAVAVVDFDPETGLVQHVGMRGTATLEPFEEHIAQAIVRKYLGEDPETWDPRFDREWDDRWRLVRFEPDTVVARDQSYDAGP